MPIWQGLPEVTLSADAPFAPKLLSVWREGYGSREFRKDAIAGLTVAIVALPLSMAIAIASGAAPEKGLYTAIIGGFLISAFGGSRFQIGGPAGAFIVLVAAIIERQGYDGLLLATMMAGVMMMALGAFRLGTLIKFIPQPVTIGFTAGIAVIIFASQIKDLLGLSLSAREPGALLPKLQALLGAVSTINPAAFGIALGTMAVISLVKRHRPHWPVLLIAVTLASMVAWLFALPVETIGSRFGGVPSSLPAPSLPALDLARLGALLPDALAIALLGSIESLLSAVVADSMTGRRHRSNTELVAQGMANIGAALFGGITATGTIARTATNVRAGAHGPVSGMLHAVYLLGFMLLLAPLMAKIPLAALAGLLAIVAWNMAERHVILSLLRGHGADAAVMLATFFITIFRDLTEGILVGVVLGAILFSVRMARLVEVTSGSSFEDDAAEAPVTEPGDDRIVSYRIAGPLFFGSTPRFGDVMSRIGIRPRVYLLDLAAVPLVDASGAEAIGAFARQAKGQQASVIVFGARPDIADALRHDEQGGALLAFAPNQSEARAAARRLLEA
ncbi:MAG: STAS domain-containing protein [Methylobacterium sp.]|nr:STAS domain-containing protein [Methylobacterium sp.]